MSTKQYVAKRAILDALEEHARTGLLSKMGEDGGRLQVKRDARPRDMERRCLYAGGTRAERPPEELIEDGNAVVAKELAYSTWFIRIVGDADEGELGKEVEEIERVAEEIGRIFEDLIAQNPGIAGPLTRSYISAVQGDHDWPEDVINVAILMYEVRTESYVQ